MQTATPNSLIIIDELGRGNQLRDFEEKTISSHTDTETQNEG